MRKPLYGPPIFISCVKIAPWCSKYRSEIISMNKNGYQDPNKVIAALKKKYHIK